MESTSYVLSFRMVFFYLVTPGWILDISLCENSINQSIIQSYEHKLLYCNLYLIGRDSLSFLLPSCTMTKRLFNLIEKLSFTVVILTYIVSSIF